MRENSASGGFGKHQTTLSLAILTIASVLAISGPTTEDLATAVIRSESHGAYNPLNRSEEELDKAAVINSMVRLQYILVNETTNQELRICFALRILETQIATATKVHFATKEDERSAKALKKYLDTLLGKQKELARQFRKLQDNPSKERNRLNPPLARPPSTSQSPPTENSKP